MTQPVRRVASAITLAVLAGCSMPAPTGAGSSRPPREDHHAGTTREPIPLRPAFTARKLAAAEIVAYDPRTDALLVTSGTVITSVPILADIELGEPRVIDLGLHAGESITSVAADPLARDLAACAVISGGPTPGRVVLFDPATGLVLDSVAVGHHPDCIAFSPDGRYLITADEGEPAQGVDPPGGVSVIALAEGPLPADRSLAASTFTLDDPADEPEYLAVDADGAWVTIQESSRLASFDFDRGWTQILDLEPRAVVIDADDRDGALRRTALVTALPQPDTIARVETALGPVLVLANEGDPSPDEDARAADIMRAGTPAPRLEIGADPNARSYLHAFGTRDLSVHDARTGRLLATTGPTLESTRQSLVHPRARQDASDPDQAIEELDRRSDNRGPEPEGLAAHPNSTVVWAGLERADAVVAFDLANPSAPRHHALIDLATLEPPASAPEGLCVFERQGQCLLAVASEGSATLHLFSVGQAPNP